MAIPRTHEVDLWNRALSRVGEQRVPLEADIAFIVATMALPLAIGTVTNQYVTGDRILIYDLSGGREINGRVFPIVRTSSTGFNLLREDGTGYQAAVGAVGQTARLPNTKAVRVCFDAWARVRDEIIRAHPWNSVVRRARLARLGASVVVSGATQASPCVLTAVAHGYSSGDQVLVANIAGMTELNDRYYTATVLTLDTFSIPVDATTYTAFSGNGTARKALTPLVPDFGYAYKYDLPDDCERVLELAEDPDYLWETEGRQVLTDAGITVPIRYARKVTDPELFDAQLTTVLVARLALELVEELTQSASKKAELRKEYEDLMSEAKRLDAQEQSGQDFAESAWVNARL